MEKILSRARSQRTPRSNLFQIKSPLLAPLLLGAAATFAFTTVPRKAAIASPSAYEYSMKSLRQKGFGKAAEELERRVGMERKKMKLTENQAESIASHILRLLPNMEKAKKLLTAMPRSTVELVRAVAERGVPIKDAEEIATFHLEFTKHMGFRNLRQFDENHSHVIGREWHQIDYSGEGVTWQQQKRSWPAVKNFKEAKYICRYFKAASRFRYFGRIYKPVRPFPQRKLHQYCKR